MPFRRISLKNGVNPLTLIRAIKLEYPNQDFSGQTIIVTGANVGLGLEAARHFVRLQAAKVILAVRSLERGEAARKSIEDSTKRSGVIEIWQLDLSSYESTKQFAARARGLARLDALIENAGVDKPSFSMAEDNETTITVNVISTFLLALLMLPKMRESAINFNIVPRLVIVSSEVHFWAKFSEKEKPRILPALADKDNADMSDRYSVSKLMQVLYVRALAPRLTESKKPNVIMNYLTPGLCHSELGREQGFIFYLFKLIFARTTEEGGRSLVFAAASGDESHGQFLWGFLPTSPSDFVLSKDGENTAERIFGEINEKLESVQPGITSNI